MDKVEVELRVLEWALELELVLGQEREFYFYQEHIYSSNPI